MNHIIARFNPEPRKRSHLNNYRNHNKEPQDLAGGLGAAAWPAVKTHHVCQRRGRGWVRRNWHSSLHRRGRGGGSGLSVSDGAHREGGREPRSRRPWPGAGEGSNRPPGSAFLHRERKLLGYRDIRRAGCPLVLASPPHTPPSGH